MSNQGILTKTIQKAIDGGWADTKYFVGSSLAAKRNNHYEVWSHHTYKSFIFNHDFAKALWGEEEMDSGDLYEYGPYAKTYWQMHLQMMVIAKNPLDYLKENI